MHVRIKGTPNASRSEWLGWEEDPRLGAVARIRIAAPPVEGKANEELCRFLAGFLGLSKSQVRLIKGGNSRVKTCEVPDGTVLPGEPMR